LIKRLFRRVGRWLDSHDVDILVYAMLIILIVILLW